ncbi:MAG TPA: tRNA epoxyqueuosine(34) reductase QueG [Thermomicrobiales bacterium]|nr:tRNA epoxyqueuosine(34) reductase QueG [Thermomicrobiales bacterium]
MRRRARELGLQVVGIASAAAFPEVEATLVARIRAGLMDGLDWFTEERARFSADPHNLMPEARSLIAVAASYLRPEPAGAAAAGPRGRVARYAWGRDYHEALKERLGQLVAALREEAPGARCAAIVDTGRVVDRAVARRAGVGWYGKNTNILTLGYGSWVSLGEILTDVALPPDRPTRRNCGRCTACLGACPTGALVAPGVLDNARCISYLTIENRGPIPRELRPLIGDWIFGCDICQEVCPVNRRAAPAAAGPMVVEPRPALLPLLGLTEDEFRRRYRHTAVARAKRRGLVRNIAVALGNAGDRAAVPALGAALEDAEPLVRGHAAWALGRLGGPAARDYLLAAAASETDAWVGAELALALAECGDGRDGGACVAGEADADHDGGV